MAARQCHHCKQWIEPGEAHDCWTTTEAALTGDLPEEVLDAWERLRETAVEFGEQRIYASHSSIMFSRRACYFFVRPTPKRLEICFFLGRAVRHPQIRSARPSSTVKTAHIVHVRHRDEVEAPLTDWLREAYDDSDRLTGRRPERNPAPRRRAVSARGKPARTSDRYAPAPARKASRAARKEKRR
jgi:hypothetical protein